MKTGFGEKCAAIRRGLGIAQEYMARAMGMKGQKAFSRFEHDEGRSTPEQREIAARLLGFSSSTSLKGYDFKQIIAAYEAGALYTPTALAEAIAERDELREKVQRLEKENERLVKVNAMLLDR